MNIAKLTPIELSNDKQILSGMVFVSPQQNIFGRPPNAFPIYVSIKGFVFTCHVSQEVPVKRISMTKLMRTYLKVSLSADVEVRYFEPTGYNTEIEEINFEVELAIATIDKTIEVDDQQLATRILTLHNGKFLKNEQTLPVEFNGIYLIVTVVSVKPKDNNDHRIGQKTVFKFETKPGQKMKMKSQKKKNVDLFGSGFKMESLQVGGLDKQLGDIFRRAFASRRFPHSIVEKFGIKHVKGILLFGPPGTGKTLVARQLAKCLKAKEFEVVNGPQIFNKYVGQSEENIRKLFAKADKDEKQYGDESPLHVLVFDEIDAICKQRGTVNNGTNTNDAVVNQLLSKIDGVEALNNIILIGMTNRKDLIDEAVLRPGRFEVHIEVGLPDEAGRQQILRIHTQNLRKNNSLGNDVNLGQLAHMTKNFTGAEIQGLVKSAQSFAFMKINDPTPGTKIDYAKNLKVERADFIKSMSDVKPQFGVDDDKFDVFLRGKIYPYGPRFDKIMNLLSSTLKMTQSGEIQLNSILLYGEPGCGKTSIASYFAKNCPFSYVKLISPEQFIGSGDLSKINKIVRIFEDAYRTKEACIIIDNIERLIEFIQVGPRFSNDMLQTLLVLIKRIPKKPDCKLLIIGTTSCAEKLSILQIPQYFSVKVQVPQLNEPEIAYILNSQVGISKGVSQQIAQRFRNISIKKLLQIRDAAEGENIDKWFKVYGEFGAV